MKPGKIIIDDKVYFEPDGLEKPNKDDFWDYDYGIQKGWENEYACRTFRETDYNKAMKAYEASKQLIEVENVVPHLIPRLNEQKVDVYYDVIFSKDNFEQIKNNQPCKAEIKNNKATIISLIK